MPVFVGAGTSSFMKGGDGVGMSTATTTTRNALSGVRPGQMIFNHTTSLMEYYNGSSWASAAALGSAQNWASSGGTSGNDSIIGGGRGSSTYTSVTQEYSNPLVTTRSVDVS